MNCPHDSYEVLVFEPSEWQEDVVEFSSFDGVVRGQYLPGHNDICRCLDCGLVGRRWGVFVVPSQSL